MHFKHKLTILSIINTHIISIQQGELMKNKSNLTYKEACELLNKSKKTVSRYIKRACYILKKLKASEGPWNTDSSDPN